MFKQKTRKQRGKKKNQIYNLKKKQKKKKQLSKVISASLVTQCYVVCTCVVFGARVCVSMSRQVGCISVELSDNGTKYLRCFVGGCCDRLTAVQSDAQVFGIILVGLLGLRKRGLG